MISQKDARYTKISMLQTKCATCRFFQQSEKLNACSRVDNSPLPMVATGSCTYHKPKTDAMKSAMDNVPDADVDDDELYHRVFSRVFAETQNALMAKLAGDGMVKRRKLGLAVKQAQDGTGTITIGGWAILFGASDLVDTSGTYFSDKQTDFMLEYYDDAPLFMEHGMNQAFGRKPIGKRTRAQKYNHGIWIEHELDSMHELFEQTMQQLNAGKLSYSTDSIEHFVVPELRKDGLLKSWPLVAVSLVPNPAEPALGEVTVMKNYQDATT